MHESPFDRYAMRCELREFARVARLSVVDSTRSSPWGLKSRFTARGGLTILNGSLHNPLHPRGVPLTEHSGQMLKLTISLLLLIAAAPVWCQPVGRGGMMRSPAFQALDADKDGVISAAELANAPALLRSLDKNGDGKLTEDEVRPQMGGRGGRSGGRSGETGETQAPTADELVKALMAFDKNGDGQLTRDELPERMRGLFDRADADKNGVLTADEIRKSAQAAATPAVRGRGEGGEGRAREGGRGDGPSFMRLDPILAALDTNADGEISSAEIAAAATSLKKLDTNGDGQLSEDEVRLNFGPGRGRGPA